MCHWHHLSFSERRSQNALRLSDDLSETFRHILSPNCIAVRVVPQIQEKSAITVLHVDIFLSCILQRSSTIRTEVLKTTYKLRKALPWVLASDPLATGLGPGRNDGRCKESGGRWKEHRWS